MRPTAAVHGRGPLAAPGFCTGLAHVSSANSSWATNSSANSSPPSLPYPANGDPRPDLQLHFLSFTPAMDFGQNTARIINLKAAAVNWFRPHGGQQTACILPALQRPRSRGYVRIRSADPLEHPDINPRSVLYYTFKYPVNCRYGTFKGTVLGNF